MKKIALRLLIAIICLLYSFCSCKKVPVAPNENIAVKDTVPKKDTLPVKDTLFTPDSLLVADSNGCAFPAIVPPQPYSNPVWHPDAQVLGFNHTPLETIYKIQNGNQPCFWYMYIHKPDSTGFYLMNRDGTGLKRITNYRLSAPAWSPDGKWLAFSLGSQLYKMRYTGSGFDTANIIQLTDHGGNFFPNWNATSDTIFYDSNMGTGGQGYYVWKMASDGSGKTGIPNTGRQPFVASDNRVYYTGARSEIYSMNKDGSDKIQYSNIGDGAETPKYWQGKLYYEGNQIGVVLSKGAKGVKLVSPAVTYDISSKGEIVYSKMEWSILNYNKQIGTLWIMNADGTNNRQFTFNNF